MPREVDMSSSPLIEVRSGRGFTPLSPVVEDIFIEDIAHALSHQCRFSGHTRVHYSVAEHSVRVSEHIEQQGGTEEEVLWGLLHDASEAYLVDLPAPLKADPTIGVAYRRAEERLMRAICTRFGLPEKQPAVVYGADMVLLATEARDLMPYQPDHWSKLTHEPLTTAIEPWTASTAKEAFLQRYARIGQ